jgi:hypothetical protein
MRLFIAKSAADPAYARGVVIRFIRDRIPRVTKGELTSHAVKNCIWPIKLALEMNDVPVAWKKVLRMIPRSPKVGKDREYTLEEIRRILPYLSLHIQVPHRTNHRFRLH